MIYSLYLRRKETKPIKAKELTSEIIEAQTKEFLAGGGKITKAPKAKIYDNKQAFGTDGILAQ